MPDDEDRDRWSAAFRELGAAELLERYRRRNELPPLAITALRDELRLRGVDPDSLRATVPRAEPGVDDDVDGEGEGDPTNEQPQARGEMQPPPDLELPEAVRSGEVSANVLVCPHCRVPNHPDATRCRNCQTSLSAEAEGERGAAAVEVATADRIGIAVIGLLGISMVVLALWALLLGRGPVRFGLLVAALGASAILAAMVLQRRGLE